MQKIKVFGRTSTLAGQSEVDEKLDEKKAGNDEDQVTGSDGVTNAEEMAGDINESLCSVWINWGCFSVC